MLMSRIVPVFGVMLLCSLATLTAQTVSIPEPPDEIVAGKQVEVSVEFKATKGDILQVQLFNSSWKKIVDGWVSVKSDDETHTFKLDIPANTAAGEGHLLQAVLYDSKWKKQTEVTLKDISIQAASGAAAMPEKDASKVKPKAKSKAKPNPIPKPKFDPSQGEWLPPLESGKWELDWSDEFDGNGEPEKWYPLLGYDPEAFAKSSEKGIRWSGKTADSAWMYSTKTGNHWKNGEGQLVMQIAANKKKSNEHGRKVEAAYLLTGRPVAWDKTEPNGARWEGKFVSPAEDSPLYISASVKSDQIVGHSTWFAFWLFTETRAYNGNPEDGTEVDIVEIVKGKKSYLDHTFNVANHWKQKDGSESKQFNPLSKPRAIDLVDVTDDQYHVWSIEWSTKKMTCYVDGKPYYTFTENIPTKPVDMMMLLTFEFKKDAWDPDQGDGRIEGPAVAEDEDQRVMSRAMVDFVRVYKKK